MQGIVKQFDELIENFDTQGVHLMKQIVELEINEWINSLNELVMKTLHSVVNKLHHHGGS